MDHELNDQNYPLLLWLGGPQMLYNLHYIIKHRSVCGHNITLTPAINLNLNLNLP